MPSTSLAVDGSARTLSCVDAIPSIGRLVGTAGGGGNVGSGGDVSVAGSVAVIKAGVNVLGTWFAWMPHPASSKPIIITSNKRSVYLYTQQF